MKKLLFSFLLLCSAYKGYCLEIYGTLVSRKNDTLHPLFSIADKDFDNYLISNNLISKLRYSNGKGNMQKISAKKVKYIQFSVQKETYSFFSIDISKDDWDESTTAPPQFYRLLNSPNSNLKLYEFYDISDVAGAALFGYVLIKDKYRSYLIEREGRYSVVSPAGYKNTLKNIFKDNQELVSKIADGTYTFKDMNLIIAEYNNWYSTK